MKISTKPLNNGECFACTIKCAKKFFKDIDGHLSFAYWGRDFSAFSNTPRYYFLKNKIKGRIIASAHIYPQGKLTMDFYAIKTEMYTNELKEKFEKIILPSILLNYNEKIVNQGVIRKDTELIVELVKNNLIIHTIDNAINE